MLLVYMTRVCACGTCGACACGGVCVCMRTRLRVCSVHSRMHGHPVLYVAPALGYVVILINANTYQCRCVVCGVL